MTIGAIEGVLYLCSKIRTRLFTLLLSTQFKEAGLGSRISPPFRFHGLNEIVLGQGAQIERDCWIQTVPDGKHNNETKLVIGSYAGIGMGASISAACKVAIGDHVLLARNVYISDHAHAFENIELPIMHQGIKGIAPVSIGRNSWLGQNVVVLPGATIGEHCVIGANSVVNSSIPDFSVAVGAPARVVKRYNRETGAWERVSLEPGSIQR
jgi:acetyltransferase-like isoleucine patch superfamily enzyme